MHGHGHGESCDGHNHSHKKPNIGFGDEEEDELRKKNQQPKMGNPNKMMMQQMMMANAMKNKEGGDPSENNKMGIPVNPMMIGNMPQMTPQMTEMSKKIFEQRQQLMKEYMAKGGESNPEAMKEMMTKMAELQKTAMLEMKALQPTSFPLPQAEPGSNDSAISQTTNIPTPNDPINLLNADLNASHLDQLINKKNSQAYRKAKNEQENKVLDAINRKDYSELSAIKATQYGILERLKELIESGKVDPNKPDSENVYLMHWAAINNRIEIGKYLLSINCSVDPIGGELESSPLNWAARSGHIQTVVFLMQSGADPCNYDVEGFSTIHLSTMFGHSIVTAYLLAKGLDPDMKDKNGVTPLMYAAQRIHSRDPAQLLLTFNARMNVQDNKGNTPLHYCVAFNNATVMKILLDKGASLDIKNHKGLDPIELALDRSKGSAANMLKMARDDDRGNLPPFLRSIGKSKEMRKLGTRIYPFFLLFYMGILFEASVSIYVKAAFFVGLYGISFLFKTLFFDKDVLKHIPFAATLAIIFWLYTTYMINFAPIVFNFSFINLIFVCATIGSWYNLYKAFKNDPGVLTSNREQMDQTIVKFVEQDEFSLEQFCTGCIVRKPLRSKHCAECDRCVSKFDHHCPWVDNCVGQNNLKNFIGFVTWTPICLAFYMYGAIQFYQEKCYKIDQMNFPQMTSFRLALQFMHCSPWVAFFTVVAALNLFWITMLAICHVYQSIFLALTTNERLNLSRYKHFETENGSYHNPYNFGFMQNLVDLIDTNFCFLKPTKINWKKEYSIQDILDARLDKKKDKAGYQIV